MHYIILESFLLCLSSWVNRPFATENKTIQNDLVTSFWKYRDTLGYVKEFFFLIKV